MPKYALLIDYEYCTGCHSCEVSCKEEHDFGVGKWGIRLYDDGPWQKDDANDQGKSFNFNHIPVPTDLCDGCEERVAAGRLPNCVHHCQAGVMYYGTIEELAKKASEKRKMVLFTL